MIFCIYNKSNTKVFASLNKKNSIKQFTGNVKLAQLIGVIDIKGELLCVIVIERFSHPVQMGKKEEEKKWMVNYYVKVRIFVTFHFTMH